MSLEIKIVTLFILSAFLVVSGCRYSRTVAVESSTDSNTGLGDSASETGGDTSTVISAVETDSIDTSTDTLPDTSTMDTETTDTSTEDTNTNTESDTSTIDTSATMYQWTSSARLIDPPLGALAIKEPSVLFYEKAWHIYATTKTAETDDWSLVYLRVDDWGNAGNAEQIGLVDANPDLTGTKWSPQLFYFRPKEIWYLVYQTPTPKYLTNTNPQVVADWSGETQFMDKPTQITKYGRYGIDFWVICDETQCHLFFADLEGGIYRTTTSIDDFPIGFSEENASVVMMATNKYDMLQGCTVYRIEETGEYLLIVSAYSFGIGRYLRSWTATSLDGPWEPQAATLDNPFASALNVEYAAGSEAWSLDGVSNGEIVRTSIDQTMTISLSDLQYLYQGMTKEDENEYGLSEFSLGLITAN